MIDSGATVAVAAARHCPPTALPAAPCAVPSLLSPVLPPLRVRIALAASAPAARDPAAWRRARRRRSRHRSAGPQRRAATGTAPAEPRPPAAPDEGGRTSSLRRRKARSGRERQKGVRMSEKHAREMAAQRRTQRRRDGPAVTTGRRHSGRPALPPCHTDLGSAIDCRMAQRTRVRSDQSTERHGG